MDRATIKAGLQEYRRIGEDIRQKLEFANGEGQEKIRQEAEDLHRVKQEMIYALNELKPVERGCIWSHYVNGKTWVWIAGKYHYSERQIRNIANKGLTRLGKIVEKKPVLRWYFQAAKRDFTP